MRCELYNEDCTSRLRDCIKSVTNPVIVSDPPFNIGYHYRTYKDNMDQGEYLDFISNIFSLCPAVIIHYPETIHALSVRFGKTPKKIVSWVYNSNTARQHRDIAFYDIKPDFTKVRQPYKNLNDKRIRERIANGDDGGRLYDWWEINQIKNVSKGKTCHPCQMPRLVMENIIGILPDNITVIDPFMGTGTTGVACIGKGVGFIGFELDSEYYEIAKERLDREVVENLFVEGVA